MKRFVPLSQQLLRTYVATRACATAATPPPTTNSVGSSTASPSPSTKSEAAPKRPMTPLERQQKEAAEAKPRPDPAAMSTILDITSAIIDVKADYEPLIARSHTANSRKGSGNKRELKATYESHIDPLALASNKRLIKRVDQRYLSHCVARLDEVCDMAVKYPSRSLIGDDLASADVLEATLAALVEAVKFIEKPGSFPNPQESTGSAQRRMFSPWLSPSSCEIFGVWTHEQWPSAVVRSMPIPTLHTNISNCCELYVGDVDVLHGMCSRLCSKEASQRLTNGADAVEYLNTITLLSKRLQSRVPDLGHLIATISFVKGMTPAQSLSVLSSLGRIRETRTLDIVKVITSRQVAAVPTYTLTDCIFGLRAAMVLNNASEPFIIELLRALAPLASEMTPRQLGTVCHLLTMMHNSRRHAALIRTHCARETRRLMPALLAQTRQHLRKFSVTDAHYVMDCFHAFHVQHPFVYTQLTSSLSE